MKLQTSKIIVTQNYLKIRISNAYNTHLNPLSFKTIYSIPIPPIYKKCVFIYMYYYNNIYTYSILSMPTRLNLWTLPKSINNRSYKSTST